MPWNTPSLLSAFPEAKAEREHDHGDRESGERIETEQAAYNIAAACFPFPPRAEDSSPFLPSRRQFLQGIRF